MKKTNCTCDFCGKEYYAKPYTLKRYKNHFCSIQCHANFKKENFKGAKNHQYGLKGDKNSSWKSDEKITIYGYKRVRCLDHPFKDCDGFVLEHRLIAEKYLLKDEYSVEVDGVKYLSPDFDVHHIDENKLNNSPDNLLIMTKEEHMSFHKSKEKIEKSCLNCNATFYVPKNREDTAICCSQDCLTLYRQSKMVEYICPICNKTFKDAKSQTRTCCSVECSNKFRNRGTVEISCHNCGNVFKIKKSRLEKSEKVFCNRKCYMQHRNKNK